jgi:hypothetical protein
VELGEAWWNSSRCDESCAVQAHAGCAGGFLFPLRPLNAGEWSQRDHFHHEIVSDAITRV